MTMPRIYYKREYDLYRLDSYRELGAWREFYSILSPLLALFGLIFGGLLFVGMRAGTPVTILTVVKFSSLAFGGAIGTTVVLIGSKHPNEFISNLFLASPLLIVGVVFLFG